MDDHEAIHGALERTLRREPYRILHAYDAAEAWAILRNDPRIRGVLADHFMPGTRGLDLLKDVRVRHPGVATVLVTGQADVTLAMSAINEGNIDRFFTKPWEGPELRTQLRSLLLEDRAESRFDEVAARAEERLLEELQPMRDAETGAFLITAPENG